MLSTLYAASLYGIDAVKVDVEINVTGGIPSFTVVGLPDNAIRESRERILTAVRNSGFDLPPKKITVNLAPADLKKEGTAFDLPIAIGLLGSLKLIKNRFPDTLIMGELALDGSIRRINGALPVAIMAVKEKIKRLIVPLANAAEAAVAISASKADTLVFGVETLNETADLLNGKTKPSPVEVNVAELFQKEPEYPVDFADIKGQQAAKKALEIAAAGGHNLLMIGPPGSGKTMLAKALPSILPPLGFEESLETTKIYSVASLLEKDHPLMVTRPFRNPHHTTSNVALIGGGTTAKPGEVSLAHNGILFLDELPEFTRNALEVLRQPLEDREVTVARISVTTKYPAGFMLVAAMNPSPAGALKDRDGNLTASPQQIQRYLSKISGPLLDRIDIHIDVPKVENTELFSASAAESSRAIRERVIRAREIQHQRFAAVTSPRIYTNAQMQSKLIRTFCKLDPESSQKLMDAMNRLNLSARAHDRILKVSRTIADLEGSETIEMRHLIQGIQYRNLDRDFWSF
ncbi:YifB family Mg chelatase-like AAA ATPase [Chlorobium phaeobacteroides]|jgi:magnesium chelatase family protein|uniref:Mg chelatase, subunit ChlI n=1 Tax=Chlorobium phaeobacteroides (strain DSM 266 / SMG 266 / 2430) TaxID=290317 RepID=A1BDY7_CHLPD|nr:YifB family Mg chelatase-like AAA ATPase [Chlorobium phaeobacteroides]ABL64614.1 Mg chelatase, subunit ChlI [Chlorobium phaeobacteroides DSM 266]MBV5326332.1 YifB family Mg chelatase-like AAA ATPase [Chlorobium sp.]